MVYIYSWFGSIWVCEEKLITSHSFGNGYKSNIVEWFSEMLVTFVSVYIYIYIYTVFALLSERPSSHSSLCSIQNASHSNIYTFISIAQSTLPPSARITDSTFWFAKPLATALLFKRWIYFAFYVHSHRFAFLLLDISVKLFQ